ncbi:MAG: threonylcarbamoyl-AMP synthase [Synergistaceae bacterium]|jgi:L-threonylcarbamoyladenylate synthase|nr:threonylcarbamoyl-AMP synthase [Synergistaceae bacterium]
MFYFKIDRWNPDPNIIARAASILRDGGLAAFPTETVYGLGANGLNPDAVKKIFRAKGRPVDNPLILHLSEPGQARSLAEIDDRAAETIKAFWPGPLTLVLPALPHVPREVTAGLSTVALRMPDHPAALALIDAAQCPVAAPSANRSGRPSPTDAEAVAADLGDRIDILLDAGSVDVGLESTVIDLTGRGVLLLRPGGAPAEKLEKFFGEPLESPGDDARKRSPGTRYRHYAPALPVSIWRPGEEEIPRSIDPSTSGFMGMTPPSAHFARTVLFDSESSYARGMFAGFRHFEAEGLRHIVVEWPRSQGIGLALQDRIWRASN